MICWRMGKTFRKTKFPPGNFQVITSKNLLVKNKQSSIKNLTITLIYLKIQTYSKIFTSIPNWICSCRDFFLYAWIPVHVWLFSNWLIIIGCKVLHFKAQWRFGNTWIQNPKVHKNAIVSHRVYEFSNWVSMFLMTLK